MVSLKKSPPQRATRKPVSAPDAPPAPVAPSPPAAASAEQAPEPAPIAADEERVPRHARVPLGVRKPKLDAEHRPGFVRRWFNEEGGRLIAARGAGYTTVKDLSTGEPKKHLVGVTNSSHPLFAYLMEIPLEYYQEDMEAKDLPLRQFDQDISRGAGPGNAPGVDGKYVPMHPGTDISRIEIKDSVRRGRQ